MRLVHDRFLMQFCRDDEMHAVGQPVLHEEAQPHRWTPETRISCTALRRHCKVFVCILDAWLSAIYDAANVDTWMRRARALGDSLRTLGNANARPLEFRHAMEPKLLRHGHRVQMLVDGSDVFKAMLDAIGEATHSVWLESYIFESGATGTRFVEALANKASSGVEVLVVVDAFGGMNLSRDDEARLRLAGVDIRFFGRFKNVDMTRWLKRDHRKLLLVDGAVAFVGGINISDDYAAQESGGKGWHDIHTQIRGPVCQSLATLFAETWRHVGGARLTMPPLAKEETVGEWAMALCSNHRGIRTQIRSHLVHALRNARTEVLLASAYFVPDRPIVRAMEEAARRGVFSYNLDYMSLLNSLELVVELVGDQSPSALSSVLRGDMHASPELDLRTWRQRSGPERFLSNVAYQFRRWL